MYVLANLLSGYSAMISVAGEVAHRWNQILPSLLNTFEQLKALGFTYYNGKVSVIHPTKLPNGKGVNNND